MPTHLSPVALFAVACAACASAILIVYLVRRPALSAATKLWLLLGLGVFPVGTAVPGNIQGFEATKERRFCGSCHVMSAHAADSNDPNSQSLAARHARNQLFGQENCYTCHADYGMFGTIVTKAGGMMHVYNYYIGGYRNMSLDDAKKAIHIKKPYPNDNCMQCHSTTLAVWLAQPDHVSSLEAVRSGRLSCASGGCHGFAHPFTKEGGR